MNRPRTLVLLVALAAAALLARVAWREAAPPATTALAVGRVLGEPAPDPGFARARTPRGFAFPADHGPHPDYRTEWWYFTGNLADRRGRPYGFQLTFFRHALTPDRTPGASAWRNRDVMLAHFAVSDPEGGRFLHRARTQRAALGLAGASAAPPAAWLRDWRCELVAPDEWTLHAEDEAYALELRVRAVKPLVAQGDRGLSQKSAEPGNASYYYSGTRLEATGELRIGGTRVPVHGTAWLDREWSTSALGPEQTGWDWFALQFADGAELMFYQLRHADGSSDAHSAGVYVDAAGTVQPLAREDVAIGVDARWKSPHSGADYPARWRLAVPRAGLDVEIAPRLADQEWTGTLVYWEGAVTVRPLNGRAPGVGYVELTGYGARAR
ncbi:MAG: carotenoid 1,2-hydratase [Gammaproteobacteria bacterium]|nr:carotenoid 1,2-hydratase [Gammaproteobacteria bacterium]